MIIERWIQEQAESEIQKKGRDGLFNDPWLNSFFALAIWLVIALVAFIWSVTPSSAAPNDGWPWTEFKQPGKVVKVHKRRRYRRKPRVKGYIYRHKRKRKPTDGWLCAREFSVTGQVKATKDRAKKSAWHEFHGAVKFALGERYADDRFARKPRFECARSTSETLTSKTIEAVGGGGVFRFRCHLRAIACKPPVTD